MKIIKVKENQSIMDISLENYGTIEGVESLLKDNPDLKNDPVALLASGIDIFSVDFYLDVAISLGREIKIDTDNPILKQRTVRELKHREITTYEND